MSVVSFPTMDLLRSGLSSKRLLPLEKSSRAPSSLNLAMKHCSGWEMFEVQNKGENIFNNWSISHKSPWARHFPGYTSLLWNSEVALCELRPMAGWDDGSTNKPQVITLLSPLPGPWQLHCFVSWDSLESKAERAILRNTGYPTRT